MKYGLLHAPARPRGLAMVALTAAVSIAVTMPAFAQQTPPAAAPKAPKEAPKEPAKTAAPKAPAKQPAPTAQKQPSAPAPQQGQAQPGQPQQQAQGQDQQIQLIYSPWTKFCLKGQDANAKQICFTGKDGRIESGQPVVAAVVIEPEGEPKKLLRVTLPLGMKLIDGTRIMVDTDANAQTGNYVICFANGCMADYEATPEMLDRLKKGQNLIIQAINANNQPLTLPLPLADFAKAYDGPPTDPKVFEEQQKKLQEELQKRADEARKNLEKQQGAGGSTPAPAAPAK
jgi:invasion protein IalB